MDAVLIFATILIVFLVLSAVSAAFGTDSRDGFADDRVRWTLS